VDPAILIIIIFIVVPIIERLLKAGKQNQQLPPPQQRLPQRPGQRLPRERLPEEWEQEEQEDGDEPESQPVRHRAETRDDPAAEMLPDDLWEILTGERRTPQRPTPRRAPGPVSEEGFSLEEGYSIEEAESLEVQPSGEWMSAPPESPEVVLPPEPYIRPNPLRPVADVVSLEEIDFDYDQRHDDFHDKLEGLGGPATVRRRAPNAYRFRNDADLRRSIVMAEILGTPRGLQ
jgi:hypothetical protein